MIRDDPETLSCLFLKKTLDTVNILSFELAIAWKETPWSGVPYPLQLMTLGNGDSLIAIVKVPVLSLSNPESQELRNRGGGGTGGRVPPFLRVRGIIPIFRTIVGQIR